MGAGKEREELPPRVERAREEVAMGTETTERVAIFAVLTRVTCRCFSPNSLSDTNPRGKPLR